MRLYKYQGAGNDFLIADNRDGHIVESAGILHFEEDGRQRTLAIEQVCDRRYGVGADGLMLLESGVEHDFHMTYFNSDGSGGMMCGNGGRCIVAFAADRGIEHFDFNAADGFHTAQILKDENGVKTVRLKMMDVSQFRKYDALSGPACQSEGWYLDTGTRHFVRMVSDLDTYDIVSEGRDIRYNAEELQPIGANVNFVQPFRGGIQVRTYEKGVEDETFACGTGIVASALASYLEGLAPTSVKEDGRQHYDVSARKDFLTVDFIDSRVLSGKFTDIWLTGPASYVAEIIL
jgi:diaminopimelate epimerase